MKIFLLTSCIVLTTYSKLFSQPVTDLKLKQGGASYIAEPIAVRTLKEPVEDYVVKVLPNAPNLVSFSGENSLHIIPSDMGAATYPVLKKGAAVDLKSEIAALESSYKMAVDSGDSTALFEQGNLFVQSGNYVAKVKTKEESKRYFGSGQEPSQSLPPGTKIFSPRNTWQTTPVALPNENTHNSAPELIDRGEKAVVRKNDEVVITARDLGPEIGIYDMEIAPDKTKVLLFTGNANYYVLDLKTSTTMKLNMAASIGSDTLQSLGWGPNSNELFAIICKLSAPKDSEDDPHVDENYVVALDLQNQSAAKIEFPRNGRLLNIEGDPDHLKVLFSAGSTIAICDPLSTSLNLFELVKR